MDRHCLEIDRCNQRGGRMFSMVDLIEAGTVTPELAAWSLAAIGRGASFLVGAVPGGAGKTTVMGALLNFVPPRVELSAADGLPAIRRGLAGPSPRRCYICHEIGSGPYYAYLWQEELRAYFELASAGHMLATNLHADTYDQARDQICRRNGVGEPALRRMNVMYFLSVGRGASARRRINAVWASDGQSDHRQVYPATGPNGEVATNPLAAADHIAAARATIDRLLAGGARTIQDVRAEIVATHFPGG